MMCCHRGPARQTLGRQEAAGERLSLAGLHGLNSSSRLLTDEAGDSARPPRPREVPAASAKPLRVHPAETLKTGLPCTHTSLIGPEGLGC